MPFDNQIMCTDTVWKVNSSMLCDTSMLQLVMPSFIDWDNGMPAVRRPAITWDKYEWIFSNIWTEIQNIFVQ